MVDINLNKYRDMFETFKRYYPEWEGRVESYAPKNEYSIRVRLQDGNVIIYNERSKSLRWLGEGASMMHDDITDDECRRVFANNLVETMHNKGFNQITLAERTGLSTAAISKYMRAQSTPTITALQKIARAMNCTPEELLD